MALHILPWGNANIEINTDFQPLLDRIEKELDKYVAEYYAKMPPLKDSTVARKKRDGCASPETPMVASGELQKTMVPIQISDSALSLPALKTYYFNHTTYGVLDWKKINAAISKHWKWWNDNLVKVTKR